MRTDPAARLSERLCRCVIDAHRETPLSRQETLEACMLLLGTDMREACTGAAPQMAVVLRAWASRCVEILPLDGPAPPGEDG